MVHRKVVRLRCLSFFYPFQSLSLISFYEAFYLCHFELLTLEVLFLHPKRVFPWDTISLSPSSMNKHVLHHFWLKSSTTKQVSSTPNMQLVVLGAVVNSLWRAVSGRRESEKERKEKKKGGGSALVGEALWRFISVQRTRPVGPWITDVMWGGELQGGRRG